MRTSSIPNIRNVSVLIALAWLLGLPTAATAETSGVRVLQRDVAQGGPAEIQDETLSPYFRDPVLVSALAALNAGSPNPAVAELPGWMESNPGHPFRPQARFAYGYALYKAERWAAAADVLADVAAELPMMADYANYFGADAAYEAGAYEDALARASQVDEESEFGPRAWFLKARALAETGQRDVAIEELRAFIRRYPDAWYRADVDIALGETLAADERWVEAAEVFSRARTTYPDTSAERVAEQQLEAVLSHIPSGERARFRDARVDDILARANALFERHRSERVIELLRANEARFAEGTSQYCEAQYLLGKSYSKLREHSNSIPFYERVRDACDGETKLKSVYNLGRARWNVDEDQLAIDAFRELAAEFPEHSYADDALLYVARIYRNQGDTAAYEAALRDQLRRYPNGDMQSDAAWLLVIGELRAGRYAEALRRIDEVGADATESTIYTRGRMAYFRARSLESLSRETEARVIYSDIISSYPLGYYSFLAFQRLRRMDSAYALELERSLIRVEDEGARPVTVPQELSSERAFIRGRILIRLGLLELAEDEFDGLRATFGANVEVDRALANLLHRAGAYHLGYRGPAQRLNLASTYPNRDTVEDWLLAYPKPFEDAVMSYAEERGIDPWLVYAIMREESRFRPDVESWANARGLMQLMHGTAQDMANRVGMGSVSATDLFDPDTNIALGTRFMQFLSERFDDHPFLMAAGYNAGAGSVGNWLEERGELDVDLFVEEIPYKQTRHYVKRVSQTWWIYHWLYGRERVVEISYELPQ